MVWPPCCAMLLFVVAVIIVGRTRPRSMPLAILTMEKELHGVLSPFLYMHEVLLLVRLWCSTIKSWSDNLVFCHCSSLQIMADKGFMIGYTHTSWLQRSDAVILRSKQQFSKGELQHIIAKTFITFQCILKGPLGESRRFIL